MIICSCWFSMKKPSYRHPEGSAEDRTGGLAPTQLVKSLATQNLGFSLSESSVLGTSSTLVEMKMSSSFKARFSFAHCRTLSTPTSVCNSSANLSWAPISQYFKNHLKRHYRGHWSGALKETTLIVILPFLFLGSTGLQLVIRNDMFHLCKSWEGQFFCASPTLEKLAKANLEEYFKRSHNKGFVWPLCVTVASTRNNLWMKSANKKTNYTLSQILEDKLYNAPVHHIQLLPQWDLQSVNLICNDKITNPSQTSLVDFSSVNTSIPNNEERGLSTDQPSLTSPQNQRASSWQWSAESWDVSLWDLGTRCSRESWKIRNIFSKQRNSFCKNLI